MRIRKVGAGSRWEKKLVGQIVEVGSGCQKEIVGLKVVGVVSRWYKELVGQDLDRSRSL